MENELIRKINIAINDVNTAYTAIANKGGNIPEQSQKTTMNLTSSIQSIPTGGNIEPLTDSFNVTKLNNTYNITSTNIGFAPIQLDANVQTKHMTKDINFDELEFTDKYSIIEEDSEKYYDKVTISISSLFNHQLELTNNSYAIPFGFNCENYNMHLFDDGNSDLYTALCILSNLNPKIHNYIQDIFASENTGISFKCIDYNISKGYIEELKSYYKYISFANIKDINNYNLLCTNITSAFSNCDMLNDDDQVIGKVSTIKGIKGISHIRICTNINIYMQYINNLGVDNVFKNFADLTAQQKSAMMVRYQTLKNTFPEEKFILQDMTDIVYEVPARLAQGFNPER